MLAEYVFGILNLDNWNLFEIWFLVLGIFMILTKQVNFVYSVNYLFNGRSPESLLVYLSEGK
jgi:uncharacterized membrane protein